MLMANQKMSATIKKPGRLRAQAFALFARASALTRGRCGSLLHIRVTFAIHYNLAGLAGVGGVR